jgi:rubrerythrin
MAGLNGTKTHENLKEAFAGESQANRRYLWFAQKADIEGLPDVASLFKNVADGETGHAHGHLEYLAEVGDPASGEPIGDTEQNLKASIAGETYEYTQMYQALPRLRATKVSRKSPSGSRHLHAPRRVTLVVSLTVSRASLKQFIAVRSEWLCAQTHSHSMQVFRW